MIDPISERPNVLVVTYACLISPQNKILLLKRSPVDTYGDSLVWEFPGGKIEKNEQIDECIEREIYEETGIKTISTSPKGYIYSNEADMEKYKGFLAVILIKPFNTKEKKVKLSEAHTDYAWTSLDQLSKYNLSKNTKQFIHDYFKIPTEIYE